MRFQFPMSDLNLALRGFLERAGMAPGRIEGGANDLANALQDIRASLIGREGQGTFALSDLMRPENVRSGMYLSPTGPGRHWSILRDISNRDSSTIFESLNEDLNQGAVNLSLFSPADVGGKGMISLPFDKIGERWQAGQPYYRSAADMMPVVGLEEWQAASPKLAGSASPLYPKPGGGIGSMRFNLQAAPGGDFSDPVTAAIADNRSLADLLGSGLEHGVNLTGAIAPTERILSGGASYIDDSALLPILRMNDATRMAFIEALESRGRAGGASSYLERALVDAGHRARVLKDPQAFIEAGGLKEPREHMFPAIFDAPTETVKTADLAGSLADIAFPPDRTGAYVLSSRHWPGSPQGPGKVSQFLQAPSDDLDRLLAMTLENARAALPEERLPLQDRDVAMALLAHSGSSRLNRTLPPVSGFLEHLMDSSGQAYPVERLGGRITDVRPAPGIGYMGARYFRTPTYEPQGPSIWTPYPGAR